MNNEENFVPSTPNITEADHTQESIPKIQIQEEPPSEDSDALWVDYDSGDDAEVGIKCAGPDTYVISPVVDRDLFSDKYINCTAVVGIGRSKQSGKELAFISHQDPEYFVNGGREKAAKFSTDLRDTLSYLIKHSEEGTVEIVLLGGNIEPADPQAKKSVDYDKSIEILKNIVRDRTGHLPTVLKGPNVNLGGIQISVLTQERKIHVL